VALGQAGASVAINYRSHGDEAEQVAETVRRAGAEAMTIQCDVADQAAVEQMVAATVKKFGKLNIVVSNAAYSARELFYEANMEDFRRTLDVTMWGAFYLTRAAAQQMISQGGGGSIVVVSSPHGYLPIPKSMPYNMSKGAIDQMARTAAIELAGHRIRVNTIVPGWIDTPGERKFSTEEAIQKAGERTPWGRLGQPDEIGRGVVFICDPKSDYMTGSSLLIDGGITLPWWANRGSGVPE
jgi:glucose 1-dehydrogenase